MDLDFKSVKALASPTRLEILNRVLEKEATTTGLADELDKSKSTVSNHLKVLTESGLLEKDEEEGRRRVVYRPTETAKAIVEGRERKVKFSVVSSALTAVTGLYILNENLWTPSQQLQSRSADIMMESADASASASQMTGAEMAMIVLGGGLVVTAVLLAVYIYIMRKL